MDNGGTSNRIETGYTLGEDSYFNREKKVTGPSNCLLSSNRLLPLSRMIDKSARPVPKILLPGSLLSSNLMLLENLLPLNLQM